MSCATVSHSPIKPRRKEKTSNGSSNKFSITSRPCHTKPSSYQLIPHAQPKGTREQNPSHPGPKPNGCHRDARRRIPLILQRYGDRV
ncbi:hypothetical protein [Rubritalea tangerina]|uniref:hypothetical protein n=1 Tax=Rubritalea tangerina TaxID=430798 RepID=UPI003610CB85